MPPRGVGAVDTIAVILKARSLWAPSTESTWVERFLSSRSAPTAAGCSLLGQGSRDGRPLGSLHLLEQLGDTIRGAQRNDQDRYFLVGAQLRHAVDDQVNHRVGVIDIDGGEKMHGSSIVG